MPRYRKSRAVQFRELEKIRRQLPPPETLYGRELTDDQRQYLALLEKMDETLKSTRRMDAARVAVAMSEISDITPLRESHAATLTRLEPARPRASVCVPRPRLATGPEGTP